MTTSIVVSTAAGEHLDVVSRNGDGFRFETGAAEAMFAGKLADGFTADALWEFYADWSNGYMTTKANPVEVQAAAEPDPTAAQLQQQWEQARTDLLDQWPQAAQRMVDELADQAQTAAEQDDLGLLGELTVSAGVIAALALLLDESASALAVSAASGVAAEAAAAGVVIAVPALAGATRVRQTADAVARIIAAGYAAGAGRAALLLAGAGPAQVRDAVAQHLTDLGTSSSGLVGDNLGALLSAAQHAGRLAVLEQHPATAYEAVEVNDRNRCAVCAKADGHRYPTLKAALKDYPAAGNKSCLGGSRCRGFLRPVFT